MLAFFKGTADSKNEYIYFLAPISLPYEAPFRSNWKKNKKFYFCYFCNLQIASNSELHVTEKRCFARQKENINFHFFCAQSLQMSVCL